MKNRLIIFIFLACLFNFPSLNGQPTDENKLDKKLTHHKFNSQMAFEFQLHGFGTSFRSKLFGQLYLGFDASIGFSPQFWLNPPVEERLHDIGTVEIHSLTGMLKQKIRNFHIEAGYGVIKRRGFDWTFSNYSAGKVSIFLENKKGVMFGFKSTLIYSAIDERLRTYDDDGSKQWQSYMSYLIVRLPIWHWKHGNYIKISKLRSN